MMKCTTLFQLDGLVFHIMLLVPDMLGNDLQMA